MYPDNGRRGEGHEARGFSQKTRSSFLNVRRTGELYQRTSIARAIINRPFGWDKLSAPGPDGPNCICNLSPDDELSKYKLKIIFKVMCRRKREFIEQY